MFDLKGKIFKPFIIVSLLTSMFFLHAVDIYSQVNQQPHQQELRTDFTDEELEMFVEAAKEVTVIQQQLQQEVAEFIESEGLNIPQFQNMLSALQDPQTELEATEEEKQAFDKVIQKIGVVEQEAEKQAIQAVENTGLSFQEYLEIMTAFQQVPEVHQRVTEILE